MYICGKISIVSSIFIDRVDSVKCQHRRAMSDFASDDTRQKTRQPATGDVGVKSVSAPSTPRLQSLTSTSSSYRLIRKPCISDERSIFELIRYPGHGSNVSSPSRSPVKDPMQDIIASPRRRQNVEYTKCNVLCSKLDGKTDLAASSAMMLSPRRRSAWHGRQNIMLVNERHCTLLESTTTRNDEQVTSPQQPVSYSASLSKGRTSNNEKQAAYIYKRICTYGSGYMTSPE